MQLLAGIEAGGTKFVCAVASITGDMVAKTRIPTTTPGETVSNVLEFFRTTARGHDLRAAGIGSFGPVDLDPESPSFGSITTTPKRGWANFNLAKAIRDGLDVEVGFETDVNAAALGEHRLGAARGLRTLVYITVGTGLGGGGMAEGRLIHGLVHPEMGHLLIPHDRLRDPYPGCCPYHGDCLEGLAAGPAIEGRWGVRGESLADDHPAWNLEAHYLALGAVNWICTMSPERVIFGGGVMRRAGLFPALRNEVKRLLNGYVRSRVILDGIDDYIVPPALGGDAGVTGALAIAQDLMSDRSVPATRHS